MYCFTRVRHDGVFFLIAKTRNFCDLNWPAKQHVVRGKISVYRLRENRFSTFGTRVGKNFHFVLVKFFFFISLVSFRYFQRCTHLQTAKVSHRCVLCQQKLNIFKNIRYIIVTTIILCFKLRFSPSNILFYTYWFMHFFPLKIT